MGDAENTVPPSLKRAAERELSRDNPDLDDEDVCNQEAGIIKKANEEMLTNRRIVKIRQNQTSSIPSAPLSNPFASVQLVAPTNATSTPVTDTNVQESQDNVKKDEDGNQELESKVAEVEKHEVTNVEESQDNVTKEEDSGNQEPENKADEVEKNEVASKARNPKSADAESAKEEAESESNRIVNAEKNIKKAETVTSFQQLSSSQNAFTGIVGTGFSSSTFSFGPITKGDQFSFPSFSFSTNGNPSPFGPICDKTEVTKIPSIDKVDIETGEENENVAFTANSELYEFLDGRWKGRGKGELKVNISTIGNGKGRLVMRAKGNNRLILNASLFPDIKLTNMGKVGITFVSLNSTGEGKDGLSTYALKFKDTAIAEQFRTVVNQHKGNHMNTAALVSSLKTPENSPKASDG